jgi:hypothetical protein
MPPTHTYQYPKVTPVAPQPSKPAAADAPAPPAPRPAS